MEMAPDFSSEAVRALVRDTLRHFVGHGRTISWASFDMPITITKGSNSSTFAYGPEHQRAKQTRGDGLVILYAGAQEVETKAGVTTVKTYWPGGAGLAGYRVYRNGSTTPLASPTTNSYTDNTVVASTAYTYRVSAVDRATPPNESAQSGQAAVTTPAVSHRSLTAIGTLGAGLAPSPVRSSTPSSRSWEMLAPSMIRAQALASGTAVALDTNGTVRLARGLASNT